MIENGVAIFVLLLLTAVTMAAVVQRLRVPYTTALAVVGVVLSVTVGGVGVHLSPSLLLFVLIPGLLFEASFQLSWTHLRANMPLVVALATVGVFLTTALVGLIEHYVLGMSLALALLMGSMVAATDPVAVVALFRRLGVPGRLANLVEAESLLNDGTGAALFAMLLGGATVGSVTQAPAQPVLDFVRLTAGGLALGSVVGFALSFVAARTEEAEIEITLTALAAYGGYLLGDRLHVSGILTVVAAGLVMGNYGRNRALSAQTRAVIDTFWGYVAFLLNSAVFLLIGIDVPWRVVASQPGAVLAGAAIAFVARAVAVYGLTNLLRPFERHVSLHWQHVLVVGGIRGAVAVALLLSLGSSPSFDTVRAVVYGTVVLSIVLQGVAIGPVAGRLLSARTSERGAT